MAAASTDSEKDAGVAQNNLPKKDEDVFVERPEHDFKFKTLTWQVRAGQGLITFV